MMPLALFVGGREVASVGNGALIIPSHPVPTCDLAVPEMNAGGVTRVIMDGWGDAVSSTSTIVSIAMTVIRAIVRAEAITVDRHILTVVPTFKTLPVLLTR